MFEQVFCLKLFCEVADSSPNVKLDKIQGSLDQHVPFQTDSYASRIRLSNYFKVYCFLDHNEQQTTYIRTLDSLEVPYTLVFRKKLGFCPN